MMKQNKNTGAEPIQVSYCKNENCACELPSKNKGKYCDTCRRERAKKTRELLATACSLAIAAIAIVPRLKHISKPKK